MMSNPLKVSIQLSIIILKLFTNTVDTYNKTTDLQIICSFVEGTKFVNKPPPECTSLSILSKYKDKSDAIISIKGNLPIVLIDNSQDYFSWPDVIAKNASDYLNGIKSFGFNYVALAHTYKSGVKMITHHDTFSESLAKFLDDAKKQSPDVGFGIIISNYMNWVKKSLDIGLLKDHVDFIILDSTRYRSCKHKNHQADMNVLATKDDIMTSLTELKELGVDSSKIIYSIDLLVESAKVDFLFGTYEDMSYSRLCSKKMSKHRKYCFNTIQNLFEKARLRMSEKTLGIFVHSIDSDDYDGKCNCKTKNDPHPEFRGLKTIAGASREDKNDVSFYDCSEGQFPVILH